MTIKQHRLTTFRSITSTHEDCQKIWDLNYCYMIDYIIIFANTEKRALAEPNDDT